MVTHLKLRQIEVLRTAIETGRAMDGAERLHVSQPLWVGVLVRHFSTCQDLNTKTPGHLVGRFWGVRLAPASAALLLHDGYGWFGSSGSAWNVRDAERAAV